MKHNSKQLIKVFLIMSFVFFISNSIFSQVVEIQKLPSTVQEFVELRNSIAITPQGGAAMFVIALKLQVEKPEIGKKCIVIAVDSKRLEKGSIYKDFQLKPNYGKRISRQLTSYPYLVNSYFKGANAENGYFAKLPFELKFTSNIHSGKLSEGILKIFVKCYGADSPRPIKMVKNNKGYWKTTEWSSIIMGIKKPIKKNNDNL